MRGVSLLGKKFVSNCELSFKELTIPKGTMFEIIEANIYWGEDSDCYKVHFNCRIPHEECIQVMTYKEIRNLISTK